MRLIMDRIELVTKVKPTINSVKVHPQLSKNRHNPVDGALVSAGSLWPLLVPVIYICLAFVPGIVEITHLCIMHGVHTSVSICLVYTLHG
jgi:hypothetical protein